MSNINNYKNYTMFNNTIIYIIIIIIIIYIIKNYKNKKTNKFNWYIILIVLLIILLYYIIKMLLIFNTHNGKEFRTTSCLIHGYNLLLNRINLPIEIVKPELLNKPFNEFIISTSHNSYIPCFQNADITSTDAIKNALILGARVIELDVFAKNNTSNDESSYIPVVTHGIERPSSDIFTTSYIYFEDCIKVISEFAKQTSDPIWIDLELNTNKLVQTQQKIKNILVKYFGNKLINNELNNKNHFTQEPIKNLLNKIIITTSKPKSSITDELSELINSYADDNFYKNTDNTNKILNEIKPDKIMQRIYPVGNVNGHLSKNFDPEPFWKNKHQLVALNFQTSDKNLIKNITMFKKCSFVHFSELNF